jgi:hypothetical protein
MTGAATHSEGEEWPVVEYSDKSPECTDYEITEPDITKQTDKLTLRQ